MTELRPCPRCKHAFLLSAFVGVCGGVVQSCASRRNRHKPASQAIPPVIGTPSVNTPSRHHSSSPPLPAHTDHDLGSFSTASSVLALEARFGRLEQRLDSQFGELITTIQASQAQSQPWPHQPFEQVPTPCRRPCLPIHSLNLKRLQQLRQRSPLLANLLAPQLKLEHLVKLRNPESRVSKEPSQPTHLAVGPGGILVGAEESSYTRASAFVKAIPNIATLTQIWLVYIAVHVRATGSLTLNEALLAYLEHLIECDQLYQWRAVADYHLAVVDNGLALV